MHPADSYMCVPTRSPKGDYADKCLPLRPGTSCCPDGYHKVLGSCEHNSEYNETKPYFHSNGSTTTHSQVAGAKATQAHKTAVSQHAPSPATKHNVHKAHAGTWPSIADPPPASTWRRRRRLLRHVAASTRMVMTCPWGREISAASCHDPAAILVIKEGVTMALRQIPTLTIWPSLLIDKVFLVMSQRISHTETLLRAMHGGSTI